MRNRKTQKYFLDIWPGFVDALATLLMSLIFVLMIFAVTQGYMGELLSGKDKNLKDLNQKLNELSQILGTEKNKNDTLIKELQNLEKDLESANLSKNQHEKKLYETETNISELLKKIDVLNQHMGLLAKNLEESHIEKQNKDLEIGNLLEKLKALKNLNKQSDLSKYRSEFFGKLRESLGNRKDISIRGDRFIFQSEIFFETASSTLGNVGKQELSQLAKTLSEIIKKFPKDINWILRIDGHTDKRPIKTKQFKSNWELSSDRAISVVEFLIEQGIPAQKLAATGFGEFQPLEDGETEESYTKNRRIEIKLDQF